MARARSLPPSILDDLDYYSLTIEAQAVLIGLVLCADDWGRGIGEPGWLARRLNRESSTIEAALADLESHYMIERYQVERQHYYCLLKWWQWQKLDNPAQPLYPAPPEASGGDTAHPPSGTKEVRETSQSFSKKVRETSRNSETLKNSSLEEEGEGEKERESENEEEGEGEAPPVNVVTFPSVAGVADAGHGEKAAQDLLTQIAQILRLPVSEALWRIVQDYRASPDLSLLGEADAAREWIDDPRRNKQRKKMTPAFFRRWLKRECVRQQETTSSQPPPSTGAMPRAQAGVAASAGLASRSLMDLEQRYKASISRIASPAGNSLTTAQSKRKGGE